MFPQGRTTNISIIPINNTALEKNLFAINTYGTLRTLRSSRISHVYS